MTGLSFPAGLLQRGEELAEHRGEPTALGVGQPREERILGEDVV